MMLNNLYTVFGIEKETQCKIILGTFYSMEEAEQFCERWGWMYDDGEHSFYMEIVD